MSERQPICDELFDVRGQKRKLRVRVYAPVLLERTTYTCRLRMGPPFNRDRPSYGEGQLQALVLGLGMLAANLYASALWKEGGLGWRGEFGGYLGLPAPSSYLDFAPYAFAVRAEDEEEALDPDTAGEIVVEESLAVYEPRHPLGVRIFLPACGQDGRWRCRVQIDEPVGIDRYALGAGGLEALWRALCIAARELYTHPLWRAGKLGAFDEPGGFLGLPTPTSLAYLTQHTF